MKDVKIISYCFVMFFCNVIMAQGKVVDDKAIFTRSMPSINVKDNSLYIIDGAISDSEKLRALIPEMIESIKVLNNSELKFLFGKGSVIIIKTKKSQKGQRKMKKNKNQVKLK